MHRRTSRTNRVALVLLGVLLLAGGAYLLLRNRNLIPGQPAGDRLYTQTESHWLGRHDWIWFGVAAVAIGVGLLALRWLWVQPRIDRVHRIYVEPELDQAGRTVLRADVLTDAIEDDVNDFPGVARARALLIGTTDHPELVLRVSTNVQADLGEVRQRITDGALPAARTALDAKGLPARVHLIVLGRNSGKRPGG